MNDDERNEFYGRNRDRQVAHFDAITRAQEAEDKAREDAEDMDKHENTNV